MLLYRHGLFCFWVLFYEQWEAGVPPSCHLRAGGEGPVCHGGAGRTRDAPEEQFKPWPELCRALDPDPGTAYLLCPSPGIGESWPTVGYASLGIFVEI